MSLFTAKERRQSAKLSLCLIKHYALKTYWGIGDIITGFLNIGIRWRGVTPTALLPGSTLVYPMDKRAHGPQS
jgi:hypothetical protein